MEHQPRLAEHIRRQPRPRDALSEARRFDNEKRRDWFKVNIDKVRVLYRLSYAELTYLSDGRSAVPQVHSAQGPAG